MTRQEAKNLCQPEGHSLTYPNHNLPEPRSAEENEDLRKLLDGKNIWLDFSSGGEETRFADDGVTVVTKWEYTGNWGVADRMGKMYKNWRLNDGQPGSSPENKVAAIMSASDGKWETAHPQNEKHFAICTFRIGETAQASAPISFPASTPTSGNDTLKYNLKTL